MANTSFADKLPAFSDRNYMYARYVCGALVSVSSIFFAYEMFTVKDFGIDVNWNLFDSAWFGILFPIGFVLALVNWGKFGHWGGQSYKVYKDSYGNKYVERDDDIIQNMFTHIIMPLVGHFLIEPVIYACLIYYPIMACVALVNVILPYLIALLLVGLSAGVVMSDRFTQGNRYRSVAIVGITILVGGGLSWAGWKMEKGKTVPLPTVESGVVKDEPSDMFETVTPKSSDGNSDDMFDDETQKPNTVDDMFN